MLARYRKASKVCNSNFGTTSIVWIAPTINKLLFLCIIKIVIVQKYPSTLVCIKILWGNFGIFKTLIYDIWYVMIHWYLIYFYHLLESLNIDRSYISLDILIYNMFLYHHEKFFISAIFFCAWEKFTLYYISLSKRSSLRIPPLFSIYIYYTYIIYIYV